MRIGIVADIHDAVAPLERALALFRERGVDVVVTLGDAFESIRPGDPGVEVGRLLAEAGPVGVWGNHDVGVSDAVPESIRAIADPRLLEYAAALTPQRVVSGCRFCHIEPWKDARSLEDLWIFEGVPETGAQAQRSFDAVPERVLFIGHFHIWRVLRADGPVDWDGTRPLRLEVPARYLVLVAPVEEGWCATFDTATGELTPLRCAP